MKNLPNITVYWSVLNAYAWYLINYTRRNGWCRLQHQLTGMWCGVTKISEFNRCVFFFLVTSSPMDRMALRAKPTKQDASIEISAPVLRAATHVRNVVYHVPKGRTIWLFRTMKCKIWISIGTPCKQRMPVGTKNSYFSWKKWNDKNKRLVEWTLNLASQGGE